MTSQRVHLTWLKRESGRLAPKASAVVAGASNYVIGNDPKEMAHKCPALCERLRFGGPLPVESDLRFHGNQDHLEMDYVVAPHADPRAIRMGIDGPSIVQIEPNGDLSVSGFGDETVLKAPIAYTRRVSGQRRSVDAKFVLESSHVVDLALGNYDASQPLTIDPVLEFAASFGGGRRHHFGCCHRFDRAISTSRAPLATSHYPTTGTAYRTTGGSITAYACNDVIVTKLNAAASTSLLYSTYIGGSNASFAMGMYIDSSGDAFLAGGTNSPNFPTSTGAYQTTLKNSNCSFSPYIGNQQCSDGFLLKLNPTGSGLIFSTLLGGERVDLAAPAWLSIRRRATIFTWSARRTRRSSRSPLRVLLRNRTMAGTTEPAGSRAARRVANGYAIASMRSSRSSIRPERSC